jgi:hypothetical protein
LGGCCHYTVLWNPCGVHEHASYLELWQPRDMPYLHAMEHWMLPYTTLFFGTLSDASIGFASKEMAYVLEQTVHWFKEVVLTIHRSAFGQTVSDFVRVHNNGSCGAVGVCSICIGLLQLAFAENTIFYLVGTMGVLKQRGGDG